MEKQRDIFSVIQQHFPSASRKEANNLLWHCTAYPMVSGDKLENQIEEIARKSGGEYASAMQIAEEEITEAMAELNP